MLRNARVLVCLALLSLVFADRVDELLGSRAQWERLGLEDYCYTSAFKYDCSTVGQLVHTVENNAVSMNFRSTSVCDSDCDHCLDESETFPPPKDMSSYTITDWYRFCYEVLEEPNGQIYFQLFPDSDYEGLLQMCGYADEGGEFVGVVITHIDEDVPEDGVCKLDVGASQQSSVTSTVMDPSSSSEAPAQSDVEGGITSTFMSDEEGDGGENDEDRLEFMQRNLELSKARWEAAETSRYCYVTRQDSFPCDRVRNTLLVTEDEVRGTSVLYACDQQCEHCHYRPVATEEYALHSLDFWYDFCESIIVRSADDYELIVSFFKDTGFLHQCGYVDKNCADDCYVGVTVTSVALGDDTCLASSSSWHAPHAGSLSGSSSSASPSPSASFDAADYAWWIVGAVVGLIVLLVVAAVVVVLLKRRKKKHPYEGYETYHPSDWL